MAQDAATTPAPPDPLEQAKAFLRRTSGGKYAVPATPIGGGTPKSPKSPATPTTPKPARKLSPTERLVTGAASATDVDDNVARRKAVMDEVMGRDAARAGGAGRAQDDETRETETRTPTRTTARPATRPAARPSTRR